MTLDIQVKLNGQSIKKESSDDRIKQIVASDFYGFDINPDLVKATKMNMVMNNDGSGNIYRNDSLLPPHEWSQDLKQDLADALKIETESITNTDASCVSLMLLLQIHPSAATFLSKIPTSLEQFDVGHIWRKRWRSGMGTLGYASNVGATRAAFHRAVPSIPQTRW